MNDLDWERVIEEIEDVGRSEIKRSVPCSRGVEHALKASVWPAHAAAREWRNEAAGFLVQARERYEPGMAQHLDTADLHADALALVRSLDMRRPARRLPKAVELTPSDLADRVFGPDQLLARIREALDAEEGGRDA